MARRCRGKLKKTYLETRNRHYPKRIERGGQIWYRAAPTPNTIIAAVGSGVVEAANKTLAAARMKRSGMRWHIKSGQAIPGASGLAEVRLPGFRPGDNDGEKRCRRQ
ncbi:MAG: hypothetical protein OXC26_04195 [Albidovulum sp.]|nr:hypothetical protein [Albidovulum sp.]